MSMCLCKLYTLSDTNMTCRVHTRKHVMTLQAYFAAGDKVAGELDTRLCGSA